MATFFDMRTANQAGLVAIAAAAALTVVHFNLSTQQLRGLTQKAPDIFMADLFDRSTTLVGPIWCVTCGPLNPSTPARDWQMQCQLCNAADVAFLQGGPSLQWLDALTLISWLNIGTANLYFNIDLQALAQGMAGTHHEASSILV